MLSAGEVSATPGVAAPVTDTEETIIELPMIDIEGTVSEQQEQEGFLNYLQSRYQEITATAGQWYTWLRDQVTNEAAASTRREESTVRAEPRPNITVEENSASLSDLSAIHTALRDEIGEDIVQYARLNVAERRVELIIQGDENIETWRTRNDDPNILGPLIAAVRRYTDDGYSISIILEDNGESSTVDLSHLFTVVFPEEQRTEEEPDVASNASDIESNTTREVEINELQPELQEVLEYLRRRVGDDGTVSYNGESFIVEINAGRELDYLVRMGFEANKERYSRMREIADRHQCSIITRCPYISQEQVDLAMRQRIEEVASRFRTFMGDIGNVTVNFDNSVVDLDPFGEPNYDDPTTRLNESIFVGRILARRSEFERLLDFAHDNGIGVGLYLDYQDSDWVFSQFSRA